MKTVQQQITEPDIGLEQEKSPFISTPHLLRQYLLRPDVQGLKSAVMGVYAIAIPCLISVGILSFLHYGEVRSRSSGEDSLRAHVTDLEQASRLQQKEAKVIKETLKDLVVHHSVAENSLRNALMRYQEEIIELRKRAARGEGYQLSFQRQLSEIQSRIKMAAQRGRVESLASSATSRSGSQQASYQPQVLTGNSLQPLDSRPPYTLSSRNARMRQAQASLRKSASNFPAAPALPGPSRTASDSVLPSFDESLGPRPWQEESSSYLAADERRTNQSVNRPVDTFSAQEPDGAVVSVNRDFNFAVINKGRHDGMMEGMSFSVLRAGMEIGRIRIEKVYDDFSAATLLKEQPASAIKSGDSIQYLPL